MPLGPGTVLELSCSRTSASKEEPGTAHIDANRTAGKQGIYLVDKHPSPALLSNGSAHDFLHLKSTGHPGDATFSSVQIPLVPSGDGDASAGSSLAPHGDDLCVGLEDVPSGSDDFISSNVPNIDKG